MKLNKIDETVFNYATLKLQNDSPFFLISLVSVVQKVESTITEYISVQWIV